jgi:DNA mismatch repair protein MutS2
VRKKEVYDTKVAINLREKEILGQQSELNELKTYLEENKRQLLKDAKEEARLIIKNANKLVENTIAEIKTKQADKEETKKLRAGLQQASENLKEKQVKEVKKPTIVAAENAEVEVGDWVKIIDTGNEAQVIEIAKNNLILALGDLRTVVKKNKVEKLRGKEKSNAAKRFKSVSSGSVADFSPEVDVRGMRTEDALGKIEQILDRAVMIGYPSLKIVHGKGDGILRKFIRDYLRKYNHVSRFEDEHADRGGDGITYAYLD